MQQLILRLALMQHLFLLAVQVPAFSRSNDISRDDVLEMVFTLRIEDAVAREVHEETGLTIAVGPPVLVNEFHDPDTGFHQVDLFFRCTVAAGEVDDAWEDPEGVVTDRRFFSRVELASGQVRFKPDSLPAAAWGAVPLYDALERIVR